MHRKPYEPPRAYLQERHARGSLETLSELCWTVLEPIDTIRALSGPYKSILVFLGLLGDLFLLCRIVLELSWDVLSTSLNNPIPLHPP